MTTPVHTGVDLLAPPRQEMIARALQMFSDAVRERYGRRFRGAYLFGSRARGDAKPFSDVDVALVVDDTKGRPSETKPLSELAYDVFLETGAEVQPWLFDTSDWNDPAHAKSSRLVRAARRDARPIVVVT